jgi:drug/metabolite transporter (DMT)-like permease
MLLVAMIWGLTTSIDKIAIAHGSEALLGFSMSLFSAMLLIAMVLVRPERGRPDVGRPAADSYPLLIVAALLAGLAVLAQFYAYRELLVSYVEAVKRVGGLVSALIGVIAFREGSFRSRIPAAAVMLLGMLLIIL